MILSVSRRTDIPAFYSEWFFNRIHAGFVDVRNPMNIHQVSRVKITPDVVDCIVFWTKNPKRMLSRLNELKDYHFYFQFTINPYDKLIESQVPLKTEIIGTFQALSSIIGSERVIWRYDPILLTRTIDIPYHIKYFEELAKRLDGFTNQCVISFVDLYKKTVSNTKPLSISAPSGDEMKYLALKLVDIAYKYNLRVLTCSEQIDLSNQGVEHGRCVDPLLVERICGYCINVRKDKNQRKECGCVESIDIGAYNTCCHACAYCYANFNNDRVRNQSSQHIQTSTLLVGELTSEDIVRERKVKSLRSHSLFE